jgi:DNA repair protein RadA/Sms
LAEQLIRERRPTLCVVDSISAMSDDALASVAGSVPQIRHAAERCARPPRPATRRLILVGHVTKDGELAGPRTLEHLVDTVVRIEGDRQGTLRFIRAMKHRFGPTGEVGTRGDGERGTARTARRRPRPARSRARRAGRRL